MKHISSSLLRTVSMNGNVRELPLSLFLLGILVYGAGFAWYMLANFDLVDLIHHLDGNADDAFYYFQIARNLAAGKFSTFDGGITQTNGYHPFWLLLLTPFYWVFDPESALFAIKAFEIMLIAGAVVLVVLAARICRQPWVLLIAALPSLYSQHGMLLGLEAAAALFMLGAFFLVLSLFARNPERWTWPLAVVAFSLPWARLEFAAISLTVTAALCVMEWSRQERPFAAALRASIVTPSRRIFAPLLGACAGIFVYFAYNRLVFGGFVPVSGAVKHSWSQNSGRLDDLVRNFQDMLHIPVFRGELLVCLEIGIYFLVAWWFVRRSRNHQDWLFLIFLLGALGLAAGHMAKFVQSGFMMSPPYARQAWYFVPAYLMMALIIPIRCYVAIHFIRSFVGPRSPRAASMLCSGVILAGTVFLFIKADFTHPFRHVDSGFKSVFSKTEVNAYLTTKIMNRVLPDDSVIGSWDSGIIGYFSRFPVVNLDGLANSWEYHGCAVSDCRKNIGPPWNVESLWRKSFHRKFGITHLVNHFPMDWDSDRIIFGGARFWIWGRWNTFKLWPTAPMAWSSADPGIELWKKMEPHFHYRKGDVGVVIENRLAQAFVKDCDPEWMRARVFAFSWIDEESGAPVNALYPWWNPRKNGLGFCITWFELPNNAIPNHIETISLTTYAEWLLEDLQPIIRSDFDVYLKDDMLIYFNDRCDRSDLEKIFFVHMWSTDKGVLLDRRKRFRRDFGFEDHGARFDDRCIAVFELPGYDIDRLQTGQRIPEADPLWEGSYDFSRQQVNDRAETTLVIGATLSD